MRRNTLRRLFGVVVAFVGVTSLANSSLPPVLSESTSVESRWVFTSRLSTNRYGHTATLLQSGKVLVVGGGGMVCSATGTGHSCSAVVNDSAELYDPENETWTDAGSPSSRAFHSASLLPTGEVLLTGGWARGGSWDRTSQVAELYDPATGKWRATGGFRSIKADHFATLLANGKVLAVGYSIPSYNTFLLHAELYDPAVGSWSTTTAPTIVAPLTLLPNGKVLTLRGNAAELYDPATEQWSSAGSSSVIRSAGKATLLRNGKVLVTGRNGDWVTVAELYDPVDGTLTVTGTPNTDGNHVLLPDGKVLLAGGSDNNFLTSSSAELYDPVTETWSPTSHLITARHSHTATLLPNNKVLVTGGVDGDFDFGTIFHNSAELYGIIAIPKITGLFVEGKKLFVLGEDFDAGAVILLNSQDQVTKNDFHNSKTTLIGKKTGKKIRPGDRVRVRNANGSFSEEFTFAGS